MEYVPLSFCPKTLGFEWETGCCLPPPSSSMRLSLAPPPHIFAICWSRLNNWPQGWWMYRRSPMMIRLTWVSWCSHRSATCPLPQRFYHRELLFWNISKLFSSLPGERSWSSVSFKEPLFQGIICLFFSLISKKVQNAPWSFDNWVIIFRQLNLGD